MTRKQIASRAEYLFKEYQAGRMTASKFCKLIAQMEQQIERMKCCANCEHSNGRGTCTGLTMDDWRECFNGNYAKWRLRE